MLSSRSQNSDPISGPSAFAASAPLSLQHSLPSQYRPLGNEFKISRLILDRPLPNLEALQKLRTVIGDLPDRARINFFITPGGFLSLPMPKGWAGQSGWNTRHSDLESLINPARLHVEGLISGRKFPRASGKIDFLTLGVDIIGPEKCRAPHAELVFVVDMSERTVVSVTGKSYPRPDQETTLVRITDLSSHLFRSGKERVLVLGCHDLNLFSPRSYANQTVGSQRREVADEMRALVAKFKPTMLLHHPHFTDTPNIWRPAWYGAQALMPQMRTWASAINYYNFYNPGSEPRGVLTKVLDSTSSGEGVLDLTTRGSRRI